MKAPATLGKRAEKRFFKLIEGMEMEIEAHKKLDNAPGLFVPCSIEVIYVSNFYAIISFCHYLEQNGDLMRDPEMTFLVSLGKWVDVGNKVYPMSFRNDFAGVDQEALTLDEKELINFNPMLQADQAIFARVWMKNLIEQQLK